MENTKIKEFYDKLIVSNQIITNDEMEIALESIKVAQEVVSQKNRNDISPSIYINFLDNDKFEIALFFESANKSENKEDYTKMSHLPSYKWFVTIHDGKPASNTFTASCRRDTTKGCLSTETFNYRVSVSNVGKEDAKIVVNCYVQSPWSENLLTKMWLQPNMNVLLLALRRPSILLIVSEESL